MSKKPDDTPTLAQPNPAEQVELTQTYHPSASSDEMENPAPTSAGRYSILGEIGRGGMGIILEAEDPDLHRRLAVKLLLREHQGDPKLVRRFLDEARICGQLQHPGIVPIHELGRLPDQRPFFTMKLIRGQTLAALLQARRDPSEDLPRFLGIFEQVCQTMAYAHSRGIIHRDLKPANIMVGSFGEVQVMDWGLAKVLPTASSTLFSRDPEGSAEARAPLRVAAKPEPGRLGDASDSVAGSVMGTPGFMAPEQARGAIEEMDARCDVFGLGAILCVMLTGKPPYDGTTQPEVYQQAVEGDLRGAYARLEACSADDEVVRLARHCLASDAKDRPCDAGVVALAMTDYRVSAADRLRAAELAKASAQAKAAAERQARRLTLALSISLGALLLSGGLGWLANERARAEKRTLLVSEVERQIEQALRLREQGRMAPVGELNAWTEAIAVIRQAKTRLGDGENEADLRQRVEELHTTLERELTDRRMLARVEEIRLRKSELKDNHFDIKGAAAEYAAAFRDYGIDVASRAREDAAARMRDCAIAAELAAALDDWSEAVDEAERRRLLDLARQADSDPWRKRLRAALAQRDRRALTAAAQANEVSDLPPATLDLLGKALAEVGDPEGSILLLRRAQRLYPDDFWLNFQLALQLAGGKRPRYAEAIRFYTAALAVRKHSAGAYLNLGNALANKGDLPEALEAYREALRLKPDLVGAHNNLGNVLADLGRLEEACAARRRAIALKPDHASAHSNLAETLLRMGHLDEALAECREAIRLDERNPGFYNILGGILEKKNRLTDAIAAYRQAAKMDPNYAQPRANLAMACLRAGAIAEAIAALREYARLRPQEASAWFDLGTVLLKQRSYDEAITSLRKALEIDPNHINARSNLAAALAGKGLLDESIGVSRQVVERRPFDAGAWIDLGQTHQQKGDFPAALTAFRRAVELDKHDARARYALAFALDRSGRLTEAVESYRQAIHLQPNAALFHNSLGNALDKQGEADSAIDEYKEAISLKKDHITARCNLASALDALGRTEEAIRACREALRIAPDDPRTHCMLGLFLQKRGKLVEARDELRRGHKLASRQPGWSPPSEQWLKRCEQLLEIEKKIPALRKGKTMPANIAEKIDLANLCLQGHGYYLDAARLFRAAFEARPELAEDLASGNRYQAARAAALLVCGRGEEAKKLPEAERAAWRKQAVAWLRADLAAWRARSKTGSEIERGTVKKALRNWRSDAAFAALRDAKELDKLSAEESKSWRQLWKEVDELLQKVSPSKRAASGGMEK